MTEALAYIEISKVKTLVYSGSTKLIANYKSKCSAFKRNENILR